MRKTEFWDILNRNKEVEFYTALNSWITALEYGDKKAIEYLGKDGDSKHNIYLMISRYMFEKRTVKLEVEEFIEFFS
ncbi:hypothetical protein D3C73_1523150 [compost metagenome]